MTRRAARSPVLARGAGRLREEYARLRREELSRALLLAGVADPVLICLDALDQEAALELPRLVRGLERLVAERRPAILVTHPYEGGHPDHDAAAFVAHAAVERVRRAGGPAPLIVEMASYHAGDDLRVMEKGSFLEPRGREVVRTLPEETRERKQRMFAAYASQREVLAAFAADVERYRRAPSYDFTRPPCTGGGGARREALLGGAPTRSAIEGACRLDRVRHLRDRVDQEPRPAVVHHLEERSAAKGDDGCPRRERFEGDERARLGDRAAHDHAARSGQQAPPPGAAHRAEEEASRVEEGPDLFGVVPLVLRVGVDIARDEAG